MICSKSSRVFFLFQAEDGIRDYKVTGVQTCALPILRGMVIGVLNTGWVRTPAIFEAYRSKAREVGREPTPDRLAYMALIGVGGTRDAGPDQGWPPDQPAHDVGRRGHRCRSFFCGHA